MIVIGVLFFMFGFVTWLNGSLIPFLQIACELNNVQAYLVSLVFYISYTVLALPMAQILRRTGYRNGMVLGLVIMTVGAILFVPAAMTRLYPVFLLALFVLGAGLTLLQTASNPYLVLIGPNESAAVRISIMGILNKTAGVVAPLLFSAYVFTGMAEFSEESLAALADSERLARLSELSTRLIEPYVAMAGLLVVLAIFVRVAPLAEPEGISDARVSVDRSVLQYPQLVLGALALFFYVGAEVIAGDTIGLFGKAQGVANFGELTAYTMAFMVVGYCIGIVAIPRLISTENALAASAFLGLLLTVLLVTADPDAAGLWDTLLAWTGAPALPDAVLYVALFGLANAMVWPAVWSLALRELPPAQIATGSALLIMAISGGALLPLLYGALADSTIGAQAAYWIMLPCYAFILFFVVKVRRLPPSVTTPINLEADA